MPNVVNCRKCGTLFIQNGKKELCDKCLDAQNKLIAEMNSFVINSPEETITIDTLLAKFQMSRKEFENLYLSGKFVRIAKKLVTKCPKCGKEILVEGSSNFLCNECAKKLQNQI